MKFIAKSLIVVLMLTLLIPLFLFSGCAGNQQVINVFNWGDYISDSSGTIDVIKQFEDETGIKVNYTTYATNEELYSKLKSSGANYDVIIPSDYMINRMISEDMLEKLDYNNIPNFSYIMDKYKNLNFDPTNEYSVPYTWGTVVLIYNTKYVTKPVDSWDILWDPDYKDKIIMFQNSRDAFGIALKKLGYSVNTTDTNQLNQAADELKNEKDVLQGYYMDEIFNKMESEEAYIAPYYAGDALTMMNTNPNLTAVYPKEGTNLFVDAMCIPKGAKNKTGAEEFINFMCRPDIAAANSEYIGYSTPNQGAYDLLSDDIKNNPITYPDDAILANTEMYLNLPEDTNKEIDSLWNDIRGSSSSNIFLFPIIIAILVIVCVIIIVLKRRKKPVNY
ncbi:MAG: spermidine/putrescine ABC transporter substrate-binding protein [Oscillospiraceae bacterium]|nr:spermidine/putrescine ABC transporter substrate-binding protein [Oscillospiraceae bacterium]